MSYTFPTISFTLANAAITLSFLLLMSGKYCPAKRNSFQKGAPMIFALKRASLFLHNGERSFQVIQSLSVALHSLKNQVMCEPDLFCAKRGQCSSQSFEILNSLSTEIYCLITSSHFESKLAL